MSPWMLRVMAVALASASLAAMSPVARQAPTLVKMVKIDGKTEPERIPEWLAWQEGLRTLGLLKREGFRDFRLLLEAVDAELIEKEGLAQRERDNECWRAQEQRQEELTSRGTTLQEIVKEQKTIVVGYRIRTLEGRDKLLAALSPDGQFALANWIAEHRANIGMFVPESDLESFKYPQ